MMPLGVSGNSLRTSSQSFWSPIFPVPFGIDQHADWLGNADGVGQLHFAAFGQTGGDDVLRHVPCHVGGRAIDLGGILAREGPATVPRPAAVGIDDDLPPGQAAIAVGAADFEFARRVDVVRYFAVLPTAWARAA